MGAPLPSGTVPVAQRDWGVWFKEHARQVGYAAGAVAVLAVAVWLYVTSQARKQAYADEALGQARATAEAGNLPLAANDLARLIDRYGGTRAADEAGVLLNEVRLLQGQGQTDIAVKDLQAFVQKSHPKYVLASAWSLLGGGLENQRKFRDAAEAYRHAAEQAPHDFLKAQYLLDVGRVLAAGGDSAGARAAYGEVLDKYGELAQAAEARVRLGEVGGTAPEAKSKQTSSGSKG
jgi:tetratricopeptide (TPR) repeat protein